MTAPLLSISLPCADEAPRSARLAVGRLPEIDSVRDDVLLVVSELVANAVTHSGALEGDDITLQLSRSRDTLTIRVRDCGRGATAPTMRDEEARGDGGFGLVLVDELTRGWGSENVSDDGRVVWAQMSVA